MTLTPSLQEESLIVETFSLHPAYLPSSIMKQGRDYELKDGRIVIPQAYLAKRIAELKVLNKRAREFMTYEIEFKDGSIFTSYEL